MDPASEVAAIMSSSSVDEEGADVVVNIFLWTLRNSAMSWSCWSGWMSVAIGGFFEVAEGTDVDEDDVEGFMLDFRVRVLASARLLSSL